MKKLVLLIAIIVVGFTAMSFNELDYADLESKCQSSDYTQGQTYDIMYGDGTRNIYLRVYDWNTGETSWSQIDLLTADRICRLGSIE